MKNLPDTQNPATEFYDAESAVYSRKRYEGKTLTYTQYFFKRRLALTVNMLKKYCAGKTGLILVDIGCADGIITRRIADAFRGIFLRLVGIDVSSAMIETARAMTSDKRIIFFRKDEEPQERFDVALSLGYLSAPMFEDEALFVLDHLKQDGLYICTFPGKNSLHAIFKLKDKPYLSDYRSYPEYEAMLRKYFKIIEKIPYGFFIPKLWVVPMAGRIIQPLLDVLFTNLLPGRFHEVIYVCRPNLSSL